MFLKMTVSSDIKVNKQTSPIAIEKRHEDPIHEQGLICTGGKIINYATAQYSK